MVKVYSINDCPWCEKVKKYLKSKNVEFIQPYFKFHLIEADHDDDKFVDCAFAADAAYIVSDDKHFNILEKVVFPKIFVLRLREFMKILEQE